MLIRRLLGQLRRRIATLRGRRARWTATRLLHGPARVRLSETEVMVVLLARDAGWFLPQFLAHHLALGAAHILVIDNGSSDETLEICRRHDRVTVLQNLLPARLHESAFRSEFAQRVAQGGWILFADADELVELPLQGPDALARLTGYCNARGYTAVLGQMLDRFSDRPYGELAALDYPQSILALDRYALSDLRRIAYADRAAVPFHWFLRDNLCADPGVMFATGGVRAALFGEDPFLSKHSLVRNLPGLVPMSHPHCASGVRVADVTLCLHHYKLAGDWRARDRATVTAGAWAHGEDARRLAAAGQGGDLRLTPPGATRWTGMSALQDQGFLYASAGFRAATGD